MPSTGASKNGALKIHIYGNRILAYGLVHTHAKTRVNPSIINGDIRGGAGSAPPLVVGRPKKVGGNRVKDYRNFLLSIQFNSIRLLL